MGPDLCLHSLCCNNRLFCAKWIPERGISVMQTISILENDFIFPMYSPPSISKHFKFALAQGNEPSLVGSPDFPAQNILVSFAIGSENAKQICLNLRVLSVQKI